MANGTSETKGLGPRDAYSMKKRSVFKQAKVGQTYTYDGRNATMPDGSRVARPLASADDAAPGSRCASTKILPSQDCHAPRRGPG